MLELPPPNCQLEDVLDAIEPGFPWPPPITSERGRKGMLWSRDMLLLRISEGRPQTTRALCLPSGVKSSQVYAMYENRFRKKTSTKGRQIYESLRDQVVGYKCAFCQQSTADTLDHYLRKTDFPFLSVTPQNLVPACSECNVALDKLGFEPTQPAKWHPYYDRFPSSDPWITATVRENSVPIVVDYAFNPPDDWDVVVVERLARMWEVLPLTRHWWSETVHVVTATCEQLLRLHNAPASTRLASIEESWSLYSRRNPAGPHAVTLRALCESEWFYTRGYANHLGVDLDD